MVLAPAACAIDPGQPVREDEVNRGLIDWLADVGQMLRTDHVELRRWLVDADFVVRDGWGHAYVRGPALLDVVRQALGTTDGPAARHRDSIRASSRSDSPAGTPSCVCQPSLERCRVVTRRSPTGSSEIQWMKILIIILQSRDAALEMCPSAAELRRRSAGSTPLPCTAF